ncbi:glycosyl hydrolase family 95 catalytic domain-containing protein [Streptomyces asiaticus]|uniref:glycosyl hydrolase family 95 catalytic domain-containing protein n=1 Tax=Streptomyces asiaticus TaxID=114695 RepID=UPI003F66D0E9
MKRRTLLTAITVAPLASAMGTASAHADDTGAIVSRTEAADGGADDWDTLSNLLADYAGHWTSPPATTDPDHLARKMADGALLGNGELGVVVGGDRNTLRLYLGKNDFWTSPGAQGAHPITLGGLTLRRVSGADVGTAYAMTQDILNAEVRTELTINSAPITARTYVADSADIVVTEVSTTGSTEVRLALDAWTKSGDSRYPAKSGTEGSTLWAERSTESGSSGQWVSRMGLATKIIGASAGTGTDSTGTSVAVFTLKPGETVTIVSAVEGGRGVTDHVSRAVATVNALTASSVADLGTKHRAWWKEFWLKSYVRVYDPTLEQYYYGSQYLLGSAARRGSTGPGLWGPWVTRDDPEWNGDYHLNYNVQAPYYGTFSSNRADVADPLNQAVLDYRSEGSANIGRLQTAAVGSGVSQEFKDAVPASTRGYLYPVAIGPQGACSEWYFWNQPTNATYASVTLVSTYEYAPDATFLKDALYPYLRQLAEFWEDYLGPREADGKYHSMGAAFEGDWAKDDALGLAAIRYVLTHAVKFSEQLGVDDSDRVKWKDILAGLPDFPTVVYNGKTVYNRDYTNTDFSAMVGRTICNLEFIHPFDQLDLDSSAARRQAAIDTLDAMNSWAQGNNLAKSYGVAARVGYPAASLQARLKSLIASKMRANLSVEQEGGGLESVAATDAINAMLLQSTNGTIRLFPNYPAGQKAHFSRLRAQGGFLVTADYDGTNVSDVSLTADNAGGPVTVLNPWPGRTMKVTDAAGAAVGTSQNNDRYTFTTTAGGTYMLSS